MEAGMVSVGRHGRIVHAVRGRLRIRLHQDASPHIQTAVAGVRLTPGVLGVDIRSTTRSIVVQYDPAQLLEADVLAQIEQAGILVELSEPERLTGESAAPVEGAAPDDQPGGSDASRADGGSTLRELLIGPPPKLDRRFAESLALSGVSLVAARQVSLALGGGMTLPAYFAIWFTLRRLTGAGRRR